MMEHVRRRAKKRSFRFAVKRNTHAHRYWLAVASMENLEWRVTAKD